MAAASRARGVGGLVGRLFEGPVDIVGDVHGEYGALLALLSRLGYDGGGGHPEGRRLVFVGDLVDRGPDSLACVRLVRRLMEAGKAQCVAGNHEVNVLLGDRKHGNGWFFGEHERLVDGEGPAAFCRVCEGEGERDEVRAFVDGLPLALEGVRPAADPGGGGTPPIGVRVVHAHWTAEAEAVWRAHGTISELAASEKARVGTFPANDGTEEGTRRYLEAHNLNALKVATTGRERLASQKFWAAGKWRFACRSMWWDEDEDSEGWVTVCGHYWRKVPPEDGGGGVAAPPSLPPSPNTNGEGKGDERKGGDDWSSEPEMFGGYGPFDVLGGRGTGSSSRVVCVDYSVGKRYIERANGLREGSTGTALAALRLPEWELVFHSGRVEAMRNVPAGVVVARAEAVRSHT